MTCLFLIGLSAAELPGDWQISDRLSPQNIRGNAHFGFSTLNSAPAYDTRDKIL